MNPGSWGHPQICRKPCLQPDGRGVRFFFFHFENKDVLVFVSRKQTHVDLLLLLLFLNLNQHVVDFVDWGKHHLIIIKFVGLV